MTLGRCKISEQFLIKFFQNQNLLYLFIIIFFFFKPNTMRSSLILRKSNGICLKKLESEETSLTIENQVNILGTSFVGQRGVQQCKLLCSVQDVVHGLDADHQRMVLVRYFVFVTTESSS